MSWLVPFILSPTGFAMQAYESIHLKVPTRNPVLELMYPSPGSKIKEYMQPFLNQQGMRRDLVMDEAINPGICLAQGTNRFTSGDAVIWIAPCFYKEDPEACRWLLKHEISHIKYNDLFIGSLVCAICSIAAALFAAYNDFGLIASIALTITIGFVAQLIFHQYCEGRADDFAIAHSTNEELKGGKRFFVGMLTIALTRRVTTLDKIQISATGEQRFDIIHPSAASRQKKIERELQQRNVQIDEMEDERTLTLIRYMTALHSTTKEAYGKVGLIDTFRALFKAQMEKYSFA